MHKYPQKREAGTTSYSWREVILPAAGHSHSTDYFPSTEPLFLRQLLHTLNRAWQEQFSPLHHHPLQRNSRPCLFITQSLTQLHTTNSSVKFCSWTVTWLVTYFTILTNLCGSNITIS